MKKLLSILLIATAFSVAAKDYSKDFYAALNKGKLEQAEKVLAKWEKASPGAAGIYVARHQYYMDKIMNEKSPIPKDADFSTLASMLAGALNGQALDTVPPEKIWSGPDYDRAMAVIDSGMAAYPQCLTMPQLKAEAAVKARNWNLAATTLAYIINKSALEGFHWQDTSGKEYDEGGRGIVGRKLYTCFSSMEDANDPDVDLLAAPLLEKAVELYPDIALIIELAARNAYSNGNLPQSRSYFTKAAELEPANGTTKVNLANIHYAEGDTATAVSILKEVAAGEQYSDDARESAKQCLDYINSPVQDLKPYEYFFRWLASATATPLDDEFDYFLAEPYWFNTRLAGKQKLRSPFDDSQIQAERFDIDGHKIFVWKFPDPERMPLCSMVAFISTPEGYRYYTLEKSLDDYWVLGTMNGTTHSNFGTISYPASLREFAETALSVEQNQTKPEASLSLPK